MSNSTTSSIYIGLTLISPINNQKRYEAVLNEILQYLTAHTSDVSIQVTPGRFLTIQSLNGSGSIGESLSLPLSPFYLHTCYYRLHSGFQLMNEDKKFAAVAWEILNIIKENFPSKIHLNQENLDQCRPIYVPMTQTEELRRQISCLMSIKEEDRPLTHDELEDAWHTLQFAEKVLDVRSQNMCLELISQFGLASQLQNFRSEIETLRRIIDRNDMSQLTSNRMLAQELIDKILQASAIHHQMTDTLQRQITEINQCEDTLSLMSENPGFNPQSTLEKPSSTRMCLFQLSESNDINRVTLILDTLSLRSKETLSQMRKKHQLNSKIISVLKKYCNGDYGFDQITSRHGTFQFNLLKLMIVLSQDYVAFLEYLQNSALDYLSQIIEEGIIFAYEDALSGATSFSQQSLLINLDLYKFLRLSLDFIELTISKQFQEFVPQIRENMRKIQQRLLKLLHKKENALLNYFIQQFQIPLDQQYITQGGVETNYTQQLADISTSNFEETLTQTQQLGFFGLNVDQMQELKAISTGLYDFSVELNYKLQRIEALNDFGEQHEEKHMRLFLKFYNLRNQQAQTKKEYYSEKVVEQQQQLLSQRKQPSVKGVQFMDIKEDKVAKENYQSMREGLEVYDQQKFQNLHYKLQNQQTNSKQYVSENNDQNQKSKEEKHQLQRHQLVGHQVNSTQKKREYSNKENQMHYIGSPLKYNEKEEINYPQNRRDHYLK